MAGRSKLLSAREANDAIGILSKHYGKVGYYLNYSGSLQLMVAAILSAQTRDETVNRITPALFVRYKRAEDFASASEADLIKYIRSVSYAGNKAVNIIASCKILVEKYNGKVPDEMGVLVSLPGVGRKTANTILINAFGKVEGIPVDTWVIKLSNRIGLSGSKSQDRIERDLMDRIDKKYWHDLAYLLKKHGKTICGSEPMCQECPIKGICPKNGV